MIFGFDGKSPVIGKNCFIAETSSVIGDVVLGDDCSVWHGASIRGDFDFIHIGNRSNVQDNATIHNAFNRPVNIGDDVTIGHNAVVHSCTIENKCLIGMGAVVLDNSVIGKGSIIAAGAVVTKNTVIPPHSLVIGIPAKVVRTLSNEEIQGISDNAEEYVIRKNIYLDKN